MFHVLILNSLLHKPMIYEGDSFSVSLPGTQGEFEILDFHKPVLSKLAEGTIVIDRTREFPIRGGVAKMSGQSLIAVVDL